MYLVLCMSFYHCVVTLLYIYHLLPLKKNYSNNLIAFKIVDLLAWTTSFERVVWTGQTDGDSSQTGGTDGL